MNYILYMCNNDIAYLVLRVFFSQFLCFIAYLIFVLFIE